MVDDGPGDRRGANWSRRFNPPRPGNLPTGVPPQYQEYAREELPANSWPAESGPGKLFGSVLLALLVVLGSVLLWRFLGAEGVVRGLWLGLLLVVAVAGGFVAYQLWRLSKLRYTLTEDALVIERGGAPVILPYDNMLGVVYRSRDKINPGPYEPLWPGLFISRFPTEEGIWESYATVAPNRRVRIRMRDRVVAISPERPILFLEALEEQRRADTARVPEPTELPGSVGLPGATPSLGEPPTEPVEPTPVQGPPIPQARVEESAGPRPERIRLRGRSGLAGAYNLFREGLLGDRVTSETLAVSIIILAAMSIYAGYSVDGLFQDVVIRWDPNGNPEQIVEPRGIWLFPALGLTILGLNTVLATLALLVDRFIARLVMVTTPFLQFFIALALWWAVH